MSPEEIKELQKKNCIFCHMVQGKVAAKKVYEDESVIGVLDINPANPGHILLIPKEHYMLMPQMPDDLIGHIFKVAKQISNVVLKALDVRGTNLIVANGSAAGQKAQHFILHVIPRKEGDGLEFTLPSNNYAEQELNAIAEKLRAKLGQKAALSAQDVIEQKTVEAEFEEENEHREDEEHEEVKPEDAQDQDEEASEEDEADKDEEEPDEGSDEDTDDTENDDENSESDEIDDGDDSGDDEEKKSKNEMDLDAISRVLNG